ncbi:MAG: hypothetical protein UX08_C0003G0007 [Candidatus Collierbacteria bacterium GW2011_GWB1_45_35]|uniref:PPM-type phosphatase domain-containing protein n=2 Tax=Candidatus Collieribacteriota TaxID=1752725 RepID=A0A0G1KRN7_9BACT|nr:MAG: hypothetical protein UW48_C0006G0112 [Microgenomates group bacterium GW2011_GWC1_44_23]KKT86135.1 MAG: hypothetical protein UW84_C0016G0019 [Candidatus Collierbacteria bacterium GW2011_GWA2_44_99]KKT96085.1 MAG: hypothetical protein UW96_C0002G0112 [Candidatus Collierbacteria bacterium GW2011_GWA1_45_15]KKU01041.1 MAG: hypothetical protein UX01_C0002G0007 [Candidatus Collierbacteria bacterium GW2011_GWB2_45_17]KKU05651.1 MAG: hypothetical protein UX08_C0003G0007 [Candidatus Collierbacte
MGLFWSNTANDCYSSISVNTGLGLSFLRIINEDGSNGWAQVYARIPFDDRELLDKGALFGVIFGTDKEGWAEKDAELMNWVEESFNKIENGGELGDFFQKWRDKYPELAGVWVWILLKNGEREIMMVRSGGTGVALLRNGKEFNFSENMVEGKVAKGKVEDDDRVAVWTDGLSQKLERGRLTELDEAGVSLLNESIKTENLAAAGLVLDFQKLVRKEVEGSFEKMIVVSEKKADEVAKLDLADERYVGPIGLKEKLINWWMKITPLMTRPRENSKRKRLAVLLGVLFLGLLLISLITGSIKIRREAEMKKWKEFSEPIEKSLSEAAGLVSLNPSGARKLIQDSKSVYEINRAEFVKGKFVKDLDGLGKKIEDSWTLVSGEKESQVEEAARIDLVRQGFKGDRMGLTKDNQLVVLDGSMGVVTTVDLSNKDIKVTAGKGEGLGWMDAVGDSNNMMVLTGSGVRNAVNGQDLVKFDAAVVKPIVLGKFGGNLYVLDQGNKEIFRYVVVGNGFGERVRWLKLGQNMSIVPVDMAIDADIWVVAEDGEVERFRRGSKEQYSLSGLTEGMKISRLAVEPEGDKIALLDNFSGAVAVCSKKTGVCSQLLKSEKLKQAKDVEFDAQGNLLVLLPGVVGILK